MKISFSAVSAWRRCQQLYHYRYIERLLPVSPQPSVAAGRMIHSYLGAYYSALLTSSPEAAHQHALSYVEQQYEREVNALAGAASAFDESVARELRELPGRVRRICARYFKVRGASDAREHEVLLVEHTLRFPVMDAIDNVTVVDLVTRSREDGTTWLWEHKTVSSVPPERHRRRVIDLQVTLYAALLAESGVVHVDGVIWNYIRRKEPTPVPVTRRGELSRRIDLDTTWDAYLDKIEELGLDPRDYREVEERLRGRETSHFFVRHTLPLVQQESILLRDYLATAGAIRALYSSGAVIVPVRNVGEHCMYCEYAPLCEAAIISGYEDYDLASRLFRKEEEDCNPLTDPARLR